MKKKLNKFFYKEKVLKIKNKKYIIKQTKDKKGEKGNE